MRESGHQRADSIPSLFHMRQYKDAEQKKGSSPQIWHSALYMTCCWLKEMLFSLKAHMPYTFTYTYTCMCMSTCTYIYNISTFYIYIYTYMPACLMHIINSQISSNLSFESITVVIFTIYTYVCMYVCMYVHPCQRSATMMRMVVIQDDGWIKKFMLFIGRDWNSLIHS